METTATIRTNKLLSGNTLSIKAMEIATKIIKELPIITKTPNNVLAIKPVGLGRKNENIIPKIMDKIMGFVKKLLMKDLVKTSSFLPK